jgi:hypothetical protein
MIFMQLSSLGGVNRGVAKSISMFLAGGVAGAGLMFAVGRGLGGRGDVAGGAAPMAPSANPIQGEEAGRAELLKRLARAEEHNRQLALAVQKYIQSAAVANAAGPASGVGATGGLGGLLESAVRSQTEGGLDAKLDTLKERVALEPGQEEALRAKLRPIYQKIADVQVAAMKMLGENPDKAGEMSQSLDVLENPDEALLASLTPEQRDRYQQAQLEEDSAAQRRAAKESLLDLDEQSPLTSDQLGRALKAVGSLPLGPTDLTDPAAAKAMADLRVGILRGILPEEQLAVYRRLVEDSLAP